MTLDSRVYVTTFDRHELEIDASLLPDWVYARNLNTGIDQRLTQYQVEQALALYAIAQEQYDNEEQGTDSV